MGGNPSDAACQNKVCESWGTWLSLFLQERLRHFEDEESALQLVSTNVLLYSFKLKAHMRHIDETKKGAMNPLGHNMGRSANESHRYHE